VLFLVPFLPANPGIFTNGTGTDARKPLENRQVVVLSGIPDPHGVQGVAGSNPAVPTSRTRLQQGEFGGKTHTYERTVLSGKRASCVPVVEDEPTTFGPHGDDGQRARKAPLRLRRIELIRIRPPLGCPRPFFGNRDTALVSALCRGATEAHVRLYG